MGIIRDSFVVLRNWADAINALPEEYQLETFKALFKYGMTGEIPEGLSAVSNAMLVSFSVGMENNIKRYNASVNNGKLGGRPKKENQEQPDNENENLKKPNKTQENQTQPNTNLNDNVNDNENDNVNDFKLVKEIKKINNKSLRECAREEVAAYFYEKFDFQLKVIPQRSDEVRLILDSFIDLIVCAKLEDLVYKQEKFTCEDLFIKFDKISDEEFGRIQMSVRLYEDDIRTIKYYIMGCVLNIESQRKEEIL